LIEENPALRWSCENECIEIIAHMADGALQGEEGQEAFYDEATGKRLPTQLVKLARREELQFFHEKGVWRVVPIAKAWQQTGKAPISVRWVDVNKGDEENFEIRSRLVARQINRNKTDEFFAATPPLEAKRMLISEAATNPKRGKQEKKLLFIDIRRAYFNAKASKETYVMLPQEAEQEGMCGELEQCMYGTREAGARWEETYTAAMVRNGFKQGKATPCTFRHSERDIEVVVHGDDFTALGTDEQLDWYTAAMQGEFDIKIRGRLGSGPKDDKEIRILNRVVRWTPEGLTYEADQRHAEIIVEELGLQASNAVKTPGVKDRAGEERGYDKPLSPPWATKFRALAARANYLAQDRPDIGYACKEICRDMSSPSEASWEKLKRLGRYLVGRPRAVYMYKWQDEHDLSIFVDSDWAGCWRTRKSTSGGIAMRGDHLIKHWSSTQPTIALSSGEAELISIIKGATQAKGLQSIGHDMNINMDIEMYTDSKAGKAIAGRRGVGKVRHLDVAELWIQDAVKDGQIKLRKVAGEENPSDILTKYVEHHLIVQHCAACGILHLEGRADSAPKIQIGLMAADWYGPR